MNKNSKPYEDFLKEMNDLHVNYDYELITDYNGIYKTRAKCTCRKCGHEWETTLNYMLKGNGCYQCKNKEAVEKRRAKEKEKFYKKMEEINPPYDFVGEYVNQKSRFKCTCHKCGHEWESVPTSMTRGYGCMKCHGIKVGNLKRKGIEKFKEDFYKITDEVEVISDTYQNSLSLIKLKCKHCGHDWEAQANNLLSGYCLNCPKCSDTNSVPNKFMMNILDDSNIEYIAEYSPEWIGMKRYDFYLPKFNTIIEVNGAQHYNGSFSSLGGRTLEEEQENDAYKKRMALENGISDYIVIDARYSNLKTLRKGIEESPLRKILKEDIDYEDVFKKSHTAKESVKI